MRMSCGIEQLPRHSEGAKSPSWIAEKHPEGSLIRKRKDFSVKQDRNILHNKCIPERKERKESRRVSYKLSRPRHNNVSMEWAATRFRHDHLATTPHNHFQRPENFTRRLGVQRHYLNSFTALAACCKRPQ